MWMGAVRRRSECARDRRAVRASGARVVVVDCLYWNSTLFCFWLARAEGNDAPDRIVGRNTHCDPIPGDDLDAEAAHAAAQLGEHFVAGVALHAVQPAAVHRDHGALHVDEIILAQSG